MITAAIGLVLYVQGAVAAPLHLATPDLFAPAHVSAVTSVTQNAPAQNAPAQNAPAQSGPAPSQVKASVKLSKDTVTIAEHFTATVKLRAPRGSTFDIPAGLDTVNIAAMDTAAAFERFDADTADGYSDVTAIYTLAAWNIGVQRPGLDSIVVHLPTGVDETIRLDRVDSTVLRLTTGDSVVYKPTLRVFVRSTLQRPRDPRMLRPKPPLDLLAEPAAVAARQKALKRTFGGLAIALVIASIVGFLAYRRYRRGQIPVPVPDPVELEFQRVESLRLIDQGKTEEHAMLMAGVLRQYLIRHSSVVRPSVTTFELRRMLLNTSLIPVAPTLTLLERVDMLKFARGRATVDDARDIGTESRSIVREVMSREQAAREAAEREAAARAQEEAEQKTNKKDKSPKRAA